MFVGVGVLLKNTTIPSREGLRTRGDVHAFADADDIQQTLYSQHLKRLFDVVFAILALPFLLPILVVMFFLARSDGGPVLFRHMRVGRGGREFGCWKIRTMCVDADKVLEDLLRSNEAARHEWNQHFKLKNDPRITRFGKVLRKTSLDELPQLLNVLAGHMSIVGPRPVTAPELERFGSAGRYYKAVRPGMTGPWQVRGRRNNDLESRYALDVDYVKTMSFPKDLRHILATIPEVMFCHGN